MELCNLPKDLLIQIFLNEDYASVSNSTSDCRKYTEYVEKKILKLKNQIKKIKTKEETFLSDYQHYVGNLIRDYFERYPEMNIFKIKIERRGDKYYTIQFLAHEKFCIGYELENMSISYIARQNTFINLTTQDEIDRRVEFLTEIEFQTVNLCQKVVENNEFKELLSSINFTELWPIQYRSYHYLVIV